MGAVTDGGLGKPLLTHSWSKRKASAMAKPVDPVGLSPEQKKELITRNLQVCIDGCHHHQRYF